MHTRSARTSSAVLFSTTALLTTLPGCLAPLPAGDDPAVLRAALLEQHRRHLAATAPGPVIELAQGPSDVAEALRDDDLLDEVINDYGPSVYRDADTPLGDALDGEPAQLTPLTLHEAVRAAVEHNLDIRIARIVPAVGEAQVVRAEAIFDAVLFAEANYNDANNLAPDTFAFGSSSSETIDVRTGVRQNLTTGGLVSLEVGYINNDQSNVAGDAEFNTADLTLQLTQPLLRGFGRDATTANISLARNQARSDRYDLQVNLSTVVANVEAAYWQLAFAHEQLKIQTQLAENTAFERDRLEPRRTIDLDAAAWADLVARTSQRQTDVIEAQEAVRRASRQLAQLVNHPDLPVSDPRIIQPITLPTGAPIVFNQYEALTTAVRERPEVAQAALSIQDAAVRLRVADNNRMPELNASFAVRLQALSDDDFESLGNLPDLDFVDYIGQLTFEQPIGNRDAEALMSQRLSERRASTIAYERQVQTVVAEVLDALDGVRLQHERMAATYDARLAASNSLRAINAREEAGFPLSPEFIDLKLNRMERLSQAYLEELDATVRYNNALAELYRSMGTLLVRNRIAFDAG